jgi:hypothetical protein
VADQPPGTEPPPPPQRIGGGGPHVDLNLFGAPPALDPVPLAPASGAPVARGTNRSAVFSVVLGIVGVACCPLAAPIAIYLSNQARGEINASGGRQGGFGLAQAGLILGFLGSVWLLFGGVFTGILLLGALHVGHAR